MQSNLVQIKVSEILSGGTALTPDSGDKVFEKIDSSLQSNAFVSIDFSQIDYMTTAFLNAAIGQLYSKYKSEELNTHLKIENLSNSDSKLLIMVIERAKEYFANKTDFEDTINNA